MPTYTYRCDTCKEEHDHVLPFNHVSPKCETCNGDLKKIMYPSMVIYKCGGFYNTDNARSTKK